MKYIILGVEVLGIFTLLLINTLITNKLQSFQLSDNRPKNVTGFVTFGNILSIKLPEVKVLSATTEATPTPPVSTPAKTPSKKSYLIAAIGDSMVDTMGSSLDYLAKSLKKKYPNTNFAYYNYGKGAENVEEALARFDKPFSYFERNYPPISHLNADILIVGSYAYNPLIPHNKDKHWQLLASLIQKAKDTGVKVIEVNLSCPNEGTNNLLCYDKDRSVKVAQAIKEVIGDIPLIIKIAYYKDENALRNFIKEIGGVVQGISAINTISAEIVDENGEQALPGEGRLRSGVCGHAIKWAGLDMVKKLKKLRGEFNYSFTIVGVGGVTTADDFFEYRNAGADVVMSATGAMWNPYLGREIAARLRKG